MTVALVVLVFTTLLCHGHVSGRGGQDLGDDAIDLPLLLKQMMVDYSLDLRPNMWGPPVTVGLSIYILSIQELPANQVDISMYFRLLWQDPRLAFAERPGLSKLILGARFLEKLWLPDIFIVGSLDRPYSGPATNENTFVRIMHSGDVLWSRKRTVRVQLEHDIGDSYYATLEMESFSMTMSDVRLRWEDGSNSVQAPPSVSLPFYNYVGQNCTMIEASLSSGNYSRLLTKLELEKVTTGTGVSGSAGLGV